jgi:hypothetical protein
MDSSGKEALPKGKNKNKTKRIGIDKVKGI